MSKVNTKVSTKSKVEMEDDEEVSNESRVNIDKSYFFKMDSRNYTLCKEKIIHKEDGSETKNETVIGYYPSLDGLFKRYFKEQVNIKIRNKTLDLLDFKSIMLDVSESLRQIAKSLDVEITVK